MHVFVDQASKLYDMMVILRGKTLINVISFMSVDLRRTIFPSRVFPFWMCQRPPIRLLIFEGPVFHRCDQLFESADLNFRCLQTFR